MSNLNLHAVAARLDDAIAQSQHRIKLLNSLTLRIDALTKAVDELHMHVTNTDPALAERHSSSNDRRINHLTRSLDNLWIQHEKHGQNLLKLQGDYHANLVKPDTR